MRDEQLAEWVRGARAGDRVAWAQLYVTLLPRILIEIRAIAPPSIDPEDVAEDAFVTLSEHLADLENDDGCVGYIRVIALNNLRRELARERQFVCLDEAPDIPAEDRSTRNLDGEEMLKAMTVGLSEKCQEVYQLMLVKGLSPDEAAKKLGVSLEVFWTRKRRTIVAMGEALLRYMGRDGPRQI